MFRHVRRCLKKMIIHVNEQVYLLKQAGNVTEMLNAINVEMRCTS